MCMLYNLLIWKSFQPNECQHSYGLDLMVGRGGFIESDDISHSDKCDVYNEVRCTQFGHCRIHRWIPWIIDLDRMKTKDSHIQATDFNRKSVYNYSKPPRMTFGTNLSRRRSFPTQLEKHTLSQPEFVQKSFGYFCLLLLLLLFFFIRLS